MRGNTTHGRRSRGRSRGGPSTRASSQGQNLPASSSTSTGNAPPLPKLPSIQWDKKNYHPRTAHLIKWCKINEDACLRIFSDSSRDAKQEGHPHQQLTTQKNTYLQQLATAIFENDEDPIIREHFHANPLQFVKPVQSRFVS